MKDIPELLKDSFYDEDGPDLAAIETVSSCSCSIDNIQQICFGALNSRFWIFRKHINCLELKDIKTPGKLPF